MMKKLIILDALVTIVLVVGIIWYVKYDHPIPHPVATINSFDECVNGHYPVFESYPRQCRTPDGRIFVEETKVVLEIPGQAKVTAPGANQLIQSPVNVQGEAKGSWYFEGTFPIEVFDANGIQLGQAGGRAEGNWMTDTMVPFKSLVTFTTPTTETGYLILKPDDPSGLGKNKSELRIPVRFKSAK